MKVAKVSHHPPQPKGFVGNKCVHIEKEACRKISTNFPKMILGKNKDLSITIESCLPEAHCGQHQWC